MLPTPRLSQHRVIPGKGGGTTPPGSLSRPVGHVEQLDTCVRNAPPPKLRSRCIKKKRTVNALRLAHRSPLSRLPPSLRYTWSAQNPLLSKLLENPQSQRVG